ncbi:MAG TPA: hypothetical protein VK638_50330 [Edaphobacter sp.]|nr:hypothetical protein [Edaphobacter sp.]
MISLLISLLFLCLIFAIFWWILRMIPVPAPFAWVVQVIFAIVFLIALVSLLTGSWGFPLHGVLR